MKTEHHEYQDGFEPFDLFPAVTRITKTGKAILRFLRPGMSLLASHGDNFVHDPTPDPEDTLASHPQLFTPDWVHEVRARAEEELIYADPTHHLPDSITRFDKLDTNRWDDMGDWSERSEEIPPDEAA